MLGTYKEAHCTMAPPCSSAQHTQGLLIPGMFSSINLHPNSEDIYLIDSQIPTEKHPSHYSPLRMALGVLGCMQDRCGAYLLLDPLLRELK